MHAKYKQVRSTFPLQAYLQECGSQCGACICVWYEKKNKGDQPEG